jgi:beta-glucosidase
MSSNIDDRTMHELYLWPFADAVQMKVASVIALITRSMTALLVGATGC